MPSAAAPSLGNQDTARRFHAQGEERLRFGDLVGAREALTQALALDGSKAETHYLLGNCLRRLKLEDEAEAAFKDALAQDMDLLPAWFGLAFLYQEHGRRQEAAEQLRRLAGHFPSNREVLHQVGGLMGDFGQYTDAAALYEKMVEVQPEARSYQRLGQYYQKQGRLPEAEAALLKAIGQNPDAGAAYLLLANTRSFKSEDGQLVERFRQVLVRPETAPSTQICLHFALGKMQDDMGHYEQAFGHFEQGNRLRYIGQNFDAAEWREFARKIGQVDNLIPTAAPQSEGPSPIFIVGMLRSGTTLVERILASHPLVSGLGEVTWLEELVAQAVRDAGIPYPEIIGAIDAKQSKDLQRDYVHRWPRDTRDVSYMVDKNPMNFAYLGFIARVFPRAKIVHCRRDARDTCLSVYFQNFANRNNNFAYDLHDIGLFYNSYEEIMQHWGRVLPAGMLVEVDYEELVTAQARTTRQLLEGLGLPWDAGCLDFHSQPDVIATASVWQARQPIYNASVGRWRHYERHLAPLLGALKPL